MNRVFKTVLAAATGALMATHAYAQNPLHTNFTQLESIGIFDTDHPQSIGNGAYYEAERSSLTALIDKADRGPWIALNKNIRNLLLTSADASTISNDIEIKDGKDLLTLRLNTLLKLGYYKQAAALSTKIPEDVKNEKLNSLSILSMLLNREKAKACLNVKIYAPEYEYKGIWKDLDSYCTFTLKSGTEIPTDTKSFALKSLANDRKFTITYDTKTFKTLGFLDQAILTAENAILLENKNFADYAAFPASHISSLLSQSNITQDQRAVLTAYGMTYGITENSDLIAQYEAIAEKENAQSDIEKIAILYAESEKLLTTNKSQKVLSALSLAEKNALPLFTPFLNAASNLDIGSDLTMDQVNALLRLHLQQDTDAPDDWIDDLNDMECNDISCNTARAKTLISALLMNESVSKKLFASSQKTLTPYLLYFIKETPSKNIIENIDMSGLIGDKVRFVYENDFDLGGNKSYTMPPYSAIIELQRLGRQQNTATVILLSGILLNNIAPEGIYHETLDDIVSALRETGMNRLSRQMMAQAVIGF